MDGIGFGAVFSPNADYATTLRYRNISSDYGTCTFQKVLTGAALGLKSLWSSW